MGKLIVAVCSTTGPQSGKSTYLEEVVRKQLPDAAHLRFSDPLISFLCDGLSCLHGKDRSSYEELKAMELLPGITGRDFMIAAGDALRNALSPSFYADILIKRLESLEADTIILDDLRKIPELAALVKSDFKVLVVNVIKPSGGKNDCEFTRDGLKTRLEGINQGIRADIRYMEVTWCSAKGFRRVR